MKYLLLFQILSITCLFGQNEFYINGDNSSSSVEVYVKGNDNNNPTLYVAGEINNNQGVFQNDSSVIELTGNFTNTANGTDAKYESNGIERFSGNSNVTISGNIDGTSSGALNGVSSGINQFHLLKLNKESNQNWTLLNDINITKNGSIEFEDSTLIVTGASILFIQNSANAAIVNHDFTTASTNGTTNYIHGKLRRALSSGDYDFPVGDANNSIPFKLFNTSGTDATSAVTGYVDAGSFAVGNSAYMYCDVATHPGSGTGLPLNAASSNAPDGVIDQLAINTNSDIQWEVDLSSGTLANYDIEVYPNGHDVSGVYSSSLGDLRYLFKDGIPFTSAGVALSNASYASNNFSETGFDQACPDNTGEYRINNLSSFSSFRLGGVTSTSGVLPVELISFFAKGINNSYIKLDWMTASEINNDGFEIQRSTDGKNFNTIAWKKGVGNSNSLNNYQYEDFEVQRNISYYYRLKQVDFDGVYEYTNIISAKLNKVGIFEFNAYPIPSKTNESLFVKISSIEAAKGDIKIYNSLGQVVVSENLTLIEGENIVEIDNSILSSGNYFIQLQINDASYAKIIPVIEE